MPKRIHCARCGKELAHKPKGVPSLGVTITVVEPHECSEEPETSFIDAITAGISGTTKHLDKALSNEPFVQKLDEATQKTKLDVPIKDTRPGRQEVSSIAPQNLRGMIDTMVGRAPGANNGREYDDSPRDTEDTEDSQIEG